MPPKTEHVHHYVHLEALTGSGSHVLEAIHHQLSAIEALLGDLMAIAKSTQDKLDAISAALDAAATGLAQDIQALKDALNAANNGMTEADVNAALAPLEARVQALTDLDAANP